MLNLYRVEFVPVPGPDDIGARLGVTAQSATHPALFLDAAPLS